MREEENGKQTKQKMVNQINTLTRNIIDDDVNDEENQTGDDRVKVVHNQNCSFPFFPFNCPSLVYTRYTIKKTK